MPLAETIDGFARLQRAGHIRSWGVSNLDTDDMDELWSLPGGREVQTNQVLYNLTRRGLEWDLLPWLRERGVPLMAYSPIEQGGLTRHRGLADFARRRGMTPAQAALAWLLANDDVIVIPKDRQPDPAGGERRRPGASAGRRRRWRSSTACFRRRAGRCRWR